MSNASNRLLTLIARVEHLEEERRVLAADVKDVFAEALKEGFDPKTMRKMIRERRLTPSERAEEAALEQIYRAALGMLDGTPLGDHARARLANPATPPPGGVDGATSPQPADAEVAPPPLPPATAEDLLAARAAGSAAAMAGRKIGENPHPAGDGRRGAWDEGWCAATGSDGMDVPPAFRRTKKPSKSDSSAPGAE